MTTLFTLVFIVARIRGLLRIIAIVVGGWLILAWLFKIRNFRGFFSDPAKRRATFRLLLPGALMAVWGIYFLFVVPDYPTYVSPPSSYSSTPVAAPIAQLFIANASGKPAKLQGGKYITKLKPNAKEVVEIKSLDDTERLRAWVGDSLVIDTEIGRGTYIGNLSDNIVVIAEQIAYGSGRGKNMAALATGYQVLEGVGIKQFSPEWEREENVLGFYREPKSSIYSETDWKMFWDVRTATPEEYALEKIERSKQ